MMLTHWSMNYKLWREGNNSIVDCSIEWCNELEAHVYIQSVNVYSMQLLGLEIRWIEPKAVK